MKLYEYEPPYLMRINIKRQGDKTEHITICETTQDECLSFVKSLIEEQGLSPFQTGKTTNIEIREGLGADNGKAVSLSFRGLSPSDTYHIIWMRLNDLKKRP